MKTNHPLSSAKTKNTAALSLEAKSQWDQAMRQQIQGGRKSGNHKRVPIPVIEKDEDESSELEYGHDEG